ncbi:MAG: hypothetical protein ASARMPREDX12_003409 [Alectoria sarmentosa]|nr:MAG: hypothetical protein ASARMPREDX12_003409 [Alectoria sarmentosa]
MSRSSEIDGLEEESMDDFEDVDIDSCDHRTKNESCNGQDISCHADGVPENFKPRVSESRPLGGRKVRVPSEEAYQQAFVPFRTDSGTSYPCNQSDLAVHNDDAFPEPNNHPYVSAMDATREVMLQNHITRRVPPTELAAIDTLRTTVYAMEKRMEFGPDLAAKAFVDLDLLFFGGRLRDHVRVRWIKASEHPRFAAAPTRLWAITLRLPQHGKCVILMNADYHLRQSNDDPLRAMFGTLLHEMCHAYRVVRCERAQRVKRRHHDEFFGTMIAVVHQRAMRVLGLWAIAEHNLYRQYHFFPGEQTATGVVVEWLMDVVLDVDDRMTRVNDVTERVVMGGIAVVKRLMRVQDVAVD